MSNLDNLTSKIIEDARNKSEDILNEAKLQETEIINKKKNEAEKLSESILEKAKIEGKSLFDRGISKAELQVRNEKLIAKQTVINRAFDEAINKLNDMKKDEFLAYVKNQIKSLPLNGEQDLIVNAKDKEKITEEFISELNSEIKNATISLSNEDRDINGGFILSKNGIEINCSFEDVINSLRYELENEVANTLFN
ncbi:V-type ATP synthase subunit E [Clostridium ihumii]|uniref:V-type ATP synthase subunit E n=1 Tax=Clostridium ihumii TaxID=1470356 RepID=UPI003D356C13